MKPFSLKSFTNFLLFTGLFFSIGVFAEGLFGNETKESEKNKLEKIVAATANAAANATVNAAVNATTNNASTSNVEGLFTHATYEDFAPQKEYEVFEAGTLGPVGAEGTKNATIDAGAVSLVQSTFLGNLNLAFANVASYALNLLYLFAALELVIFGLLWALRHDVGLDKLFFKILKIGLIFFVIQNYMWLLDTVMRSFAQLAGVVIKNSSIASYVFNPAKIWQYGYNAGVHLLQLATMSSNYGMVMVQISLGVGILLVFGLLGIQMILQIVGFYLVSFGALILLPFGAFILGYSMFDRAVQSVLQAGIRLMSLIIIIGIAVVIWDGFNLVDLATTTKFSINQPLGLFFTALLFLYLVFYLPKILSQVVGSFGGDFLDGGAIAPIVIREPAAASMAAVGEVGNMQAATAIDAAGSSTFGGYAMGGGETGVAAASPISVVTAPGGGGMEARIAKETLAKASVISKSISESTVKKIKDAVLKAVKEK